MSASSSSSSSSAPALLETIDLAKDYHLGDQVVHAVRSVSIAVSPGEFVAVMGPSGSGKSTFMHLLGCLDRPSAGSYFLGGHDVAKLSNDQLARLRNQRVGFVFQSFNLMSRISALENVALPLSYAPAEARVPRAQRRRRAAEALWQVGLQDRGEHLPTQLSGGQQQRVAIARALINRPDLILADEPTGALDSRTGIEIMGLLQRLNRDGMTVIIVTHEAEVAAFAGRVLRFRDGLLVADEANNKPADAEQLLAEWTDAGEGAPA